MINSVVNACRAIEYVVELGLRKTEAKLPDIADHLGLQKTTARNLLRTLEQCGYLRRTARGIYAPGRQCATLAQSSEGYAGLRGRALPVMNRLAATTGEGFGLAVLFNGHRFCICRVVGGADVAVNAEVVDEGPCYGTITTRALLAFASAEERQAFISCNGLPSEAEWPEAFGDQAALVDQLEEIRGAGLCSFARNSIVAIAAPLMDSDGNLVAALGTYAPAFRTDEKRLADLRRLLVEGASQIRV